MVDIRSATARAENRQRKKKKKERKKERKNKIETTDAKYNGLPYWTAINS